MANPKIGEIIDGHIFQGGDPGKPDAWAPVPAGWVLDNHRFKGGDPGDQGNWERLSVGERAGRYIDDLMRQTASGASMGTSDEVAALAGATRSPRGNLREAVQSYQEGRPNEVTADYDRRLAEERARDQQFKEGNPIAATTANIGGAVLSGLGLGRNIPAVAPYLGGGAGSLVARAGRGAVGGGVLGGITGFASGEGGLDERLGGAGSGAAVGALIGGAAPVVAEGLGRGARIVAESAPGRWVGENVVSPVASKIADAADAIAPRAPARALSAAPEGGQPLPVDSMRTQLAERMRQLSSDTSGQGIAKRGAIERLLVRMDRDALTPQQLSQELASLGDDAALFLGAGPNTRMLAKTTARLPGGGMKTAEDAATAEARSIGPRMMGEVEQSVAPDTRFFTAFEKAAAKRQTEAGKLFDAARGQKLNISGDMQEMAKIPMIREAIEKVQADAIEAGKTLTPVDIAHRVKQTMANIADAKMQSGVAVNKADVEGLANQWRAALHKANPAIARADDAYSASSKVMEALDAGRNFLVGGTGERGTANAADALAARFAQMSGPEQEAFRVGVASQVRQQVMKGPEGARAFAKQLDQSGLLREKLVEIVGPVNAERIFNMAGKEMKRAAGWRGVMGGSDTAWNAAALADEGVPALIAPNQGGLTSRLLNAGIERWQQGMRGNEAVRNELAGMLFLADPTMRARVLDELATAAAARGSRPVTAGAISAGSRVGPMLGDR